MLFALSIMGVLVLLDAAWVFASGPPGCVAGSMNPAIGALTLVVEWERSPRGPRSIAQLVEMLNRNFSAAAPTFFPGRAALAALGFAALGVATAHGAFRCPFAFWFHVPCPACGSTRSVKALLHGRFDALVNPIAPLAAALLVVLAGRVVWLLFTRGDARGVGEGAFGRVLVRAFVVAVTLEIALWALRWLGLFGGPVPV